MTWNTQEISVPAQYERLQKLLVAGEWKVADQETARVMKGEKGFLNDDDIKNFSCEDLRTIDQLWVKYSNGRFGFSVQKNIWLECGGKVDYETECKLGDRLGWRVMWMRGWFRGWIWILYKDLIFSIKAPIGHLPEAIHQSCGGRSIAGEEHREDAWMPYILSYLFSRIKSCNL
jgi:hypothetical protein